MCYQVANEQQQKDSVQEASPETKNPTLPMPTGRRSANQSLAETISAREASQRNSLTHSQATSLFPTSDIEEIRDHYEKVYLPFICILMCVLFYLGKLKVLEIPFNSVNKWQMSIHDTALDLFDITDPSPSSPIDLSEPIRPCNGDIATSASTLPTRSSEAARGTAAKGFSLRRTPKPGESPQPTKKLQTRSINMQTQSTIVPFPEFMCVKGAPDVLLSKCSHFVVTIKGKKGHKILPVDPAWKSCVTAAFEEMAAQVFSFLCSLIFICVLNIPL